MSECCMHSQKLYHVRIDSGFETPRAGVPTSQLAPAGDLERPRSIRLARTRLVAVGRPDYSYSLRVGAESAFVGRAAGEKQLQCPCHANCEREALTRVPIRLVAIDLDGTLLDSQWQVPEINRRAIARAIEAGVHVVLVTGRRFDFTRSILEQLSSHVAVIVNNGALIKAPNGDTLQRRLLPRDVARQVLEETREFRPHTAVVFDRPGPGQVVFERIAWDDPLRQGYFERNRPFLAEVFPLEDSLTEDPIQVMYTGGVGPMRAVVGQLRRLDFSGDFALAVAEYEQRDFTIVDVIERGCSKGNALHEWAGRLEVRREQILAIGDNLNDREMLEFAGLGVIMGNAVPELKSMGWPVTLSNDDGGVAAAIERYVLRDRKS